MGEVLGRYRYVEFFLIKNFGIKCLDYWWVEVLYLYVNVWIFCFCEREVVIGWFRWLGKVVKCKLVKVCRKFFFLGLFKGG